MKIVLIGTGNVATILGKMLTRAGYTIVQVYGRSPEKAASLSAALSSGYCCSWKQIDPSADIYLVSIRDAALENLPLHLQMNHQVVLHTAGAISLDVLAGVSPNHGVLYPLQSLRRDVDLLTEIPFLGEASNAFTRGVIEAIGNRLGGGITFMPGPDRLRLHLAAVCINNFGNHLFILTADFCQQEKIDFQLLAPIALETAKRISIAAPQSVVTGPAIRNDHGTIDKHLELLGGNLLLQQLYRQFTESIQAYYGVQANG